MKLIYIFLEEDYKNIPKGGYTIDNEFLVTTFNADSREIEIKKNNEYHKPFNDSIDSINCIVGKNGIGKTTFFELIIAPLLWRLDGEILTDKLYLLFYDEDIGFVIQSYIQNRYYNWNTSLTKNSITGKIDLKKNSYLQNDNKIDKSVLYSPSTFGFSVLPFRMNIIFHSLSPFDRIYSLVKNKLSGSYGQQEHYHKRFKYIGIKQIENDEIKYEHMTIINLLTLFFSDTHKKMINNLGYHFFDISLEINNEYFTTLKLPKYNEFDETQKQQLDIYLDSNEYIDIVKLLEYPPHNHIDENLVTAILLKNLAITTPANFLMFLYAVEKIDTSDKNIIDKLKYAFTNLQDYFDYPLIFNDNNIEFLKSINITDIVNLNKLTNNDTLKSVIENKEIAKILKILKKLTAKNILEFKINLTKNSKKIDFLRLSSGEKTLISYFANILARINEIYNIQGQDTTYNSIADKTFLILIDEVELHLHPEWQRNFIKQLNDFFNFPSHPVKLQFIIATHSPFVVSDMYNENIIYLGDKNNLETKTFSGNIFDIFKDDFYVSNTIGSFSEEIIQELSEFLYFLFIFKKSQQEKNYFMLRDFFDLMYELANKDEDNDLLKEKIIYFLENGKEQNDEIKFHIISSNKYFNIYMDNKKEFYTESKNIIDKIGEPVIQEHLEKMYYYLKED